MADFEDIENLESNADGLNATLATTETLVSGFDSESNGASHEPSRRGGEV